MNNAISKKDQILNAGLAVMREHGYNGTGVKDIVDAAGVPKGSFYNYFESKELFVVDALRQVAAGNLVQMRRMLGDSAMSPMARFKAFFKRNVEHLKRTSQFSGGCFIGTISQEVADTNESIRKVTNELLREYEQVFAQCLMEAKNQNELDDAVNTENMASFIFSAWEGALLNAKACRNAEPLDAFLAELTKYLSVSSS